MVPEGQKYIEEDFSVYSMGINDGVSGPTDHIRIYPCQLSELPESRFIEQCSNRTSVCTQRILTTDNAF
jgi:hypothetical protein